MSSFRLATISDYWRTANKRKFPIQLECIKFNNCNVLNNLSVDFGNGIHALSGANGVGKSSLIKMLFNNLVNVDDNVGGRQPFTLQHTSHKNLTVNIKNNDKLLSIQHDTDHELDVAIFDPCTLVPTLQNFYQHLSDIDEIVSAHGSYKYNSERLITLNYVTSHAYKNVECTDIEENFTESLLSTMPFFKVINRYGLEYDSRTMGLGEFSLFYFDWLINRLISSQCKLLLLEEPESYLPPLIQRKLTDVIAFLAYKHSIQSIICTHSDSILDKINRRHVTTIRKVGPSLKAFNANTNFDSLKSLGLTARKKGIIFCEDEAALSFSKYLVAFSNNHVIDNFYYHISGSNGDIEKILKELPNKIEQFKFYALFDGDCKKRNQTGFNTKSYGYLPGDSNPENLLIPYFDEISAEGKAAIFSKTVEEVELAIDNIQGLEAHDYLNEFFCHINITKSIGFDILVEAYIKNNIDSHEIISCLKAIDAI
ncbi:ATP-dependent nuclease [Marinomonas sp. PE14-40]|uniref:ATP-dependent nuclease n=1 Tax=Marinomonas sp. PE14-40 TaxID=3060621 RepID=UPI003F66E538